MESPSSKEDDTTSFPTSQPSSSRTLNPFSTPFVPSTPSGTENANDLLITGVFRSLHVASVPDFIPSGSTQTFKKSPQEIPYEEIKKLLIKLSKKNSKMEMEKRIAVLQDLCSTIKNIDPDGQGLEECLDLLIPLDRQKLSNGLSLEIILEDTRVKKPIKEATIHCLLHLCLLKCGMVHVMKWAIIRLNYVADIAYIQKFTEREQQKKEWTLRLLSSIIDACGHDERDQPLFSNEPESNLYVTVDTLLENAGDIWHRVMEFSILAGLFLKLIEKIYFKFPLLFQLHISDLTRSIMKPRLLSSCSETIMEFIEEYMRKTAGVWKHLAGELERLERKLTRDLQIDKVPAKLLNVTFRLINILMDIMIDELKRPEMVLSTLGNVKHTLKSNLKKYCDASLSPIEIFLTRTFNEHIFASKQVLAIVTAMCETAASSKNESMLLNLLSFTENLLEIRLQKEKIGYEFEDYQKHLSGIRHLCFSANVVNRYSDIYESFASRSEKNTVLSALVDLRSMTAEFVPLSTEEVGLLKSATKSKGSTENEASVCVEIIRRKSISTSALATMYAKCCIGLFLWRKWRFTEKRIPLNSLKKLFVDALEILEKTMITLPTFCLNGLLELCSYGMIDYWPAVRLLSYKLVILVANRLDFLDESNLNFARKVALTIERQLYREYERHLRLHASRAAAALLQSSILRSDHFICVIAFRIIHVLIMDETEELVNIGHSLKENVDFVSVLLEAPEVPPDSMTSDLKNWKNVVMKAEPAGSYRQQHFLEGVQWMMSIGNESRLKRISVPEFLRGLYHSCQTNSILGVWWTVDTYAHPNIEPLLRLEQGMFWLAWETARFCVLSRLKTVMGDPVQSLLLFESRFAQLASTKINVNDILPTYTLLLTMDILQRQILAAAEGPFALDIPAAVPSRLIAQFFQANKSVCEEWYARTRPNMITVASELRDATTSLPFCKSFLEGFILRMGAEHLRYFYKHHETLTKGSKYAFSEMEQVMLSMVECYVALDLFDQAALLAQELLGFLESDIVHEKRAHPFSLVHSAKYVKRLTRSLLEKDNTNLYDNLLNIEDDNCSNLLKRFAKRMVEYLYVTLVAPSINSVTWPVELVDNNSNLIKEQELLTINSCTNSLLNKDRINYLSKRFDFRVGNSWTNLELIENNGLLDMLLAVAHVREISSKSFFKLVIARASFTPGKNLLVFNGLIECFKVKLIDVDSRLVDLAKYFITFSSHGSGFEIIPILEIVDLIEDNNLCTPPIQARLLQIMCYLHISSISDINVPKIFGETFNSITQLHSTRLVDRGSLLTMALDMDKSQPSLWYSFACWNYKEVASTLNEITEKEVRACLAWSLGYYLMIPDSYLKLASSWEAEKSKITFEDAFFNVVSSSSYDEETRLSLIDLRKTLLNRKGASIKAFATHLSFPLGSCTKGQQFEVLSILLELINQDCGVHLEEIVNSVTGAQLPVWLDFLPQLFSRLVSSQTLQSGLSLHILKQLSILNPKEIVYRTISGATEESLKPSHGHYEQLLRLLRDFDSSLVHTATLFLGKLRRMSSLIDERVDYILGYYLLQINKKIDSVQKSTEVGSAKKPNEVQKANSGFQAAWSAAIVPLVTALKGSLISLFPANDLSVHERNFKNDYAEKLLDLINQFDLRKSGTSKRTKAFFQDLKMIADKIHKSVTHTRKVNLNSISDVDDLDLTCLPMPCRKDGSAKIISIEQEVLILGSKTKPKKLTFLGSGGEKCTVLLKGTEDLNLDDRMSQFFHVLSLARSPTDPNFAVRRYNVLPFGFDSGLIEWVENTKPLYELFKKWQLVRQNEMVNKESVEKSTFENLVKCRPSEAWALEIIASLNKRNLPKTTSRRLWPKEVLREAYSKLAAASPKHLLYNEILLSKGTPSEWIDSIQKMRDSVVNFSSVEYVLAIGDRHLDNILFDHEFSNLVHIDFNVIFGRGKYLKVPELVPCRLTENFLAIFGPHNSQVSFLDRSENTLNSLKSKKDLISALSSDILMNPWCSINEPGFVTKQLKESDLYANIDLLREQIVSLQCEDTVKSSLANKSAVLKVVIGKTVRMVNEKSKILLDLSSQAEVVKAELSRPDGAYKSSQLEERLEECRLWSHEHKHSFTRAKFLRDKFRDSSPSISLNDKDLSRKCSILVPNIMKHLWEYIQVISPVEHELLEQDYFSRTVLSLGSLDKLGLTEIDNLLVGFGVASRVPDAVVRSYLDRYDFWISRQSELLRQIQRFASFSEGDTVMNAPVHLSLSTYGLGLVGKRLVETIKYLTTDAGDEKILSLPEDISLQFLSLDTLLPSFSAGLNQAKLVLAGLMKYFELIPDFCPNGCIRKMEISIEFFTGLPRTFSNQMLPKIVDLCLDVDESQPEVAEQYLQEIVFSAIEAEIYNIHLFLTSLSSSKDLELEFTYHALDDQKKSKLHARLLNAMGCAKSLVELRSDVDKQKRWKMYVDFELIDDEEFGVLFTEFNQCVFELLRDAFLKPLAKLIGRFIKKSASSIAPQTEFIYPVSREKSGVAFLDTALKMVDRSISMGLINKEQVVRFEDDLAKFVDHQGRRSADEMITRFKNDALDNLKRAKGLKSGFAHLYAYIDEVLYLKYINMFRLDCETINRLVDEIPPSEFSSSIKELSEVMQIISHFEQFRIPSRLTFTMDEDTKKLILEYREILKKRLRLEQENQEQLSLLENRMGKLKLESYGELRKTFKSLYSQFKECLADLEKILIHLDHINGLLSHLVHLLDSSSSFLEIVNTFQHAFRLFKSSTENLKSLLKSMAHGDAKKLDIENSGLENELHSLASKIEEWEEHLSSAMEILKVLQKSPEIVESGESSDIDVLSVDIDCEQESSAQSFSQEERQSINSRRHTERQTPEQFMRALTILKTIGKKLSGYDPELRPEPEGTPPMSGTEHVRAIVEQAQSVENLSMMFEGWMAWI